VGVDLKGIKSKFTRIVNACLCIGKRLLVYQYEKTKCILNGKLVKLDLKESSTNTNKLYT